MIRLQSFIRSFSIGSEGSHTDLTQVFDAGLKSGCVNLSQHLISEQDFCDLLRHIVRYPALPLTKGLQIDLPKSFKVSSSTYRSALVLFSVVKFHCTLIENSRLADPLEPLFAEEAYTLVPTILEQKDPIAVLEAYHKSFTFDSDSRSLVLLALVRRFFSIESSSQEGPVVQDLTRFQKKGPWILPEEAAVPSRFLFRMSGGESLNIVFRKEILLDLWDKCLKEKKGELILGSRLQPRYIDGFFGLELLFQAINKNEKHVFLDFDECNFEKSTFATLLLLLRKCPYVTSLCFGYKTVIEFYDTLMSERPLAPFVVNFAIIGAVGAAPFPLDKLFKVVDHAARNKSEVGVALEYLMLTPEQIQSFLSKPLKQLSLSSNILDDRVFSYLPSLKKLKRLDLSANRLVNIEKIIPLIEDSPIEYLDLSENQAAEESLHLIMDELQEMAPLWTGADVILFPQRGTPPSEELLKRWEEVCEALNIKCHK